MATALAVTPASQRMFADYESKNEFEYRYISPIMMKTLGSQVLGGSLSTDKIKMFEIVKTQYFGNDKKVQEKINNVIQSKKLELLSTDSKHVFYAHYDEKQKKFDELLLLKYGDKWKQNLSLYYIVGDLSLDDISTLFKY